MSDQRAAAFLNEMGIDTLWLLRSAPPLAESVAVDPIARMDWPTLRTAIASCQRCSLCKGGRPVAGVGAESSAWIVVAGPVSSEVQEAGDPLAGQAGQLLSNMLRAAGHNEAYVTHLVKCRPSTANGADRAPTPEEMAACRPYLDRELALTGATTILALGQTAANALAEVSNVTATLRPQDVLLNPMDKARVWADLCKASSDPAGV